MLIHLNPQPQLPARTVVIGAGGFVGGAIVAALRRQKAEVVALARRDIDLLASDAAAQLASRLRPGDAVVAAAAIAPCRNVAMMVDNMALVRNLVAALRGAEISHLVNISSDAVYADEPVPLTEASPAAPTTMHGAMHLAREIALGSEVAAPIAALRPTLIYGAGDPHNGYGPNRFRRLANAGSEIVLFGEGEERRDHVLIDDVADLALRVLAHRSRGVLNVASGAVHSFRDVAERVVAAAARPVPIRASPRTGPMPHNGYRPFDNSAVTRAFPGFAFTTLADGIARAQSQDVH